MKRILIVYLLIKSISTMAQQQENIDVPLPFSKTITANDFVFISGQVGIDETTGKLVNSSFEAETHQVMKNIGVLLQKERLEYNDLVSVTIYLKNMDNYQLTNKIYSSYFKGALPSRVCIAVADLPAKANIEIAATAKIENMSSNKNKETVKLFLETVRSGKVPDNANIFMADTVLAHQANAEEQITVKRTPQNYSEHIKEFLTMYGNFSFEITELISENDKVYARWIQKGKHLSEIDGHAPTGKALTEIASAVYRLDNDKIVEYWIQVDRFGFEKQLQQNK
jgi:reactive intermediate/imine deaminase